jgi:hypothetical protein
MMAVDGGASYGGMAPGTALEVKSEEVSLPALACMLDLADVVPATARDCLMEPGDFDLRSTKCRIQDPSV